MKLEDYNPEKLVAELKANTRLNPEYNGMSLPLADLLGHEPEAGVTYIAWALPKAEEYYVEIFDPAEIVYASAASIKIDLAVSNITFEGADLLVTPKGTSTYYAGVVAEGDYDPAIMVDDFNSRDAWILDGYAKVNGEYDGPLAEYGGETVLIPGLTYIAYAAPVGDIEVYTEDDIYSVRVVIPALVAGGSATVSVGDVTATTNSVSATVSAGEETYRYYTDYLPKEEFDRMTDDQVVTRLVERGVSKSGGEEYTVEKTGLKPNVEGYIVAVAVDKDGKRSELVKKDANTSDLEFSSIAVEAVASTVGLVSAEISVSSTADIVKFHYINKKVTEWTASFLFKGDDAITEKELAIKTNYQVMAADAVDGKVSLPFDNLTAGEKYVFCVVGVDKDGVPTRMKKIEYTPGIDKFVRKDDALWTANYADRPVLSNFSIVEGEFGQTISADITVGSKCARYWVFANDPSYISGTGAKAKTVSVITAYGTKELTGSATGEVLYEYFHSEYMKVYVVWQDTDGNYYEYDEVAFQ